MNTRVETAPAAPLSGPAWLREERGFLFFSACALVLIGLVYPHAAIARWVGFAIAAYSAVANDSVQTLGTFLGSNRDRPWWHQWLWIGGIFLCTVAYSWYAHAGDVTFERLANKGFETAPTQFTFLQVAAPLVLLFLTRLGIPVSTTLLLLSCFVTERVGLEKVLTKSVAGYGIAFVVAISLWLGISKVTAAWQERGAPSPKWRTLQWLTTGGLWCVWLMQDLANVAVFLPRSLSLLEFGAFAGAIFFGLGVLFYKGGDKVQEVVEKKSRVTDIRAATIIDLAYALVLYVFKIHSKVPMSTTWVFVGLLAGREFAMSLRGVSGKTRAETARLIFRDLGYVTIGLLVSVVLALLANASLNG